MHQDTINRLLTLNKEFYQSFAEPFSDSRGRVQPGVLHAIEALPQQASVLDLGCGNGTLVCKLHELGYRGTYIGLDSSAELLSFARENNTLSNAHFLHMDISNPDWSLDLQGPFDRVFSFAVIHHIPGDDLRKGIYKAIYTLLKPDGYLNFSVWNFLASPRLRERILPWEIVDIDPEDVDQGDYLLDWRRGGYGIRYVHHFEPEELSEIARETGFKILDQYYSDGEGGKLGYYQVWQPV